MIGRLRNAGLAACLALLLLPVYWMVNLSLRANADILGGLAFLPADPTLANYKQIFADPVWRPGFVNAILYVGLNTAISVGVALPAAYAFSRYRFLGDKHMLFWLLTNRLAPPAVFLLPFVQLYSTFGLIDTHIAVALAHTLFTVPLAVWILEGFMSRVPRKIDETAYMDGYGFARFFITVFAPLIRAGIGTAAFFCFLFSWAELLLARALTATAATPFAAVMAGAAGAAEPDWGLLAAAGVLAMAPGALGVWFVRNHIARGFAMGRT